MSARSRKSSSVKADRSKLCFRSGVIAAVLIRPRFRQSSIRPAFVPARPPTRCSPRTSPSKEQESSSPPASFSPTSPPTFSSPATVPRKEQFSTVPAFVPARPPISIRVPPGQTLPQTVRSLTCAPGASCRKKPRREPSPRSSRPEIVWPLPRKVPAK